MKYGKFIILSLIVIMMRGVVFGSFETLRQYNPRGIAMGHSIMADDDPINGFLYNPALVAYAKSLEWQGIFGLPFTGLNDGKFLTFDSSIVVPFTYHFKYDKVFKNLVMGFSFNRIQAKSDNALYIDGDELNYAENLFSIAVAKKLENIFSYGTILSIGIAANILYHGFLPNLASENNQYITSTKKTTFGLDIGATYFLNKNMIIAGVMENLVPPNASLSKNKDFQPLTSKLGLVWKFPKLFFMKNATASGAMWFRNWDIKDDSRTAPREYHLGYEFWEWEKLLGVRLGYQWSDFGKSKIKGFSIISLGLACAKAFSSHEIQVDYAFQFPLSFSSANTIVGTFGSHIFSLTYRWSWPKSYFEFDPQKREELRQIEEMQKQYQNEKKLEKEDIKEQQKTVSETGNIEAANANDPDSIMTVAVKNRNKQLLELYNGYVEKRDSILNNIKKIKEDSNKKIADIDKKISSEEKKINKAKDEEKPALQENLKNLQTERETIVKDMDTQVSTLEKQLSQLRKDTSLKLKSIQADYQKIWNKNKKKVTENFKEEPPAFNYEEFDKEVNTQ